MINSFSKVAIASSGLALSLTLSQINPTQAATVFYNLAGTIAEGSLTGETFSGTFSFDDSLLTGSDYEVLNISQLDLNFLGSNFTIADADSDPTVEFLDGNFLGISFSVSNFNPVFTLIPGFSDSTDATFIYIEDSDGGFGNIQYSVIPEPLTLLGTGTALGFALLFKKLKQKQ